MSDLNRMPDAVECEFPVMETHGIARLQNNRLLASSEGLGWRHLYASLASEQSWSATVRPVQHHCLAYCLHQSARITRRLAGGRVKHTAQLRPRHFGTVPQGMESHWEVEGSPQVLLLYLHKSLMDKVIEQTCEKPADSISITPILGTPDPLLEQLAAAVLDAVRQRDGTSTLYIDCLAHTIAAHLLHRYGARPTSEAIGRARPALSQSGLQRAVDYIETALEEDLSLEVLAAQAGYSSHFFARAFRAQMGVSPHRYILDRRIERAKHLLIHTDMPLVQIALHTGFSSQSHFSSAFKRLTGVTAGGYRRG